MAGLVPGAPAETEGTRVAAIKELLDRGYGKATQLLAGDAEAPPLAIEFSWADATSALSAPEPISDVVANGCGVRRRGHVLMRREACDRAASIASARRRSPVYIASPRRITAKPLDVQAIPLGGP
jgi:hypothetical protein